MRVFRLILAVLAAAQWAVAQPAQIILIRHAEKSDDPNDVHLSPAGEKRARELVAFLTTDPKLTKHGPPVALFATQTTRHGRGQRTQETLAPLATDLQLRIEAPYLSDNYEALARMILANPKYEGKTVVICWNHEQIPQLTAALGVRPPPPKWKENIYDRVYLITYRGGTTRLKDLPQNFSAGATKHKKHSEKR
ncbi:MAG: hypothetical protein ACYDH9_07580 [Limisphaerales bacterium]